MMKGKLYGEGLAGDFEEDDMITALVRELLSDINLGESADAVWASLAAEQGRVLSFDPTSGYRSEPVDTLVRKEQSAEDTPAITNPEAPDFVMIEQPTAIVPFPTFHPSRHVRRTVRRAAAYEQSGQLSLFELNARSGQSAKARNAVR